MSEFKNILTDRRTEDSLTANMALFYFLIPGPGQGERTEIFLIYPGRDLALSSSLISGLAGPTAFYPVGAGGAASQRVSDHCFIGEI